ncbi:MAG TPA: F0F1 ATP synthase subunit alpha, partial [Aggregatilineales bacterium]|nr:F0F1 ATP synthase subunit alpha [Aggregatilineales bacterium]
MADITHDITKGLLDQIAGFQTRTESVEVGQVMEVGDGIARASGLANVRAQELVQFSTGAMGVAFNLEDDNVGIIIMGDYLGINEGDEVRATGRISSVPVGAEMLGRVVDVLGNPLDGKGPINATGGFYPLEK